MNNAITRVKRKLSIFVLIILTGFNFFSGCKQTETTTDKRIKQLAPATAAQMAASVDSLIKPQLPDSNLTLKLWGVD